MKKLLLSFATIILFAAAFTGCNSNSPKAAADKFLTNLYHMNYDEAKNVSTDETKKMLDMIAQFSSMAPDSVKETAKKIKVDIKDVKEEGDNATVTYTASDPNNKDAAGTEQKIAMVKQNGKWLAQWDKQNGMGGNEPNNDWEDAQPADPTMTDSSRNFEYAAPADGTMVDTLNR